MPYFNIVAQTNESTVVTEYEPVKAKSDSYQSEAELEREFIRMLQEQGYEYLQIHTEDDLIFNLRAKLEVLNNYTFSQREWDTFFAECIANKNEGIEDKARRIQEDYVQVLKRDDGTSKNISLIDKKNIHNNTLQVINQYEVNQEQGAKHDNRYDVTVLVNGLPLVHIELKKRGVLLGADVPYCLMRGTVLAEGIGEILTPLPPMPKCHVLIAKPPVSISTKTIYEKLDSREITAHPDIDGIIRGLEEQNVKAVADKIGNVLETVTEELCPVISRIKGEMKQAGAMNAMMSGSGPTVFGLFKERSAARKAGERIRQAGLARQVYTTTIHNVRRNRRND